MIKFQRALVKIRLSLKPWMIRKYRISKVFIYWNLNTIIIINLCFQIKT